MADIRTILCPIDFSTHSRRALDHAVAIARWYGSKVIVLHVYSAAPVAAYLPGVPERESTALTPSDRDALAEHVARFIDAETTRGIDVETAIREGTPVDGILEFAQRADLLAIGTHGRSGFERLVLGSVTEKVLRKARCPVLTVPSQMPDAVPATSFTRILCPVDFSECSLRAVHYAMSLADKARAQLLLLHVMVFGDPDSPEMFDTLISDARLTMSEFRRRCERARRERLAEFVPEDVRAGRAVASMVTDGRPYQEILKVAAEQRSDLIVMGVQGRSAADLMFFGSTAQHVIRQAACPVLTLRSG